MSALVLAYVSRDVISTSACATKNSPSAMFGRRVLKNPCESRLRVVPNFSSGIIFLSPRRVSPFLSRGDFHARSRFARSTIPEEKWGTTRSLVRIRSVFYLPGSRHRSPGLESAASWAYGLHHLH